jgi:hypothetical protein
MKTLNLLTAEPADPTSDFGPRYRSGPIALFVAIFCAFSAAGGGLVLWREGLRLWACLAALLFGAAVVWIIWSLVGRFRRHAAPRRSHALLADVLGFDIICTCRDVAATVFFEPDSLAPGATARVLFFVENYASRQRIARFRFGPHAALGLSEAQTADLNLAAGQAAVYVLPLAVSRSAAPGEHDLPVTLRAESPTGAGLRLPVGRHHLHDLWTVHFAAPFTLSAVPAPSTALPEKARYVSLASISKPAPFEALEDLLANLLGTASRPGVTPHAPTTS